MTFFRSMEQKYSIYSIRSDANELCVVKLYWSVTDLVAQRS